MSFIEWKDLFDDIFENYPDKWTLTCVYRNNQAQCRKLSKQRSMQRTEFAKFHCPKCSNSWASAKAMVILYFPNPDASRGKVTLRFLGQQCKKCSHNNFVDPEFENDSIKLILNKLYDIFGCLYYGKRSSRKLKTNKNQHYKIDGPHEKDLCEACRLGYCDQA